MSNSALQQKLAGIQTRSLAVGGALVAVLLVFGYALKNPAFYQAYLIGFFLALGATLGGLGLLCIVHLAGGEWSFNVRRITEAASRNVLPMAILGLPIMLAGGHLYPWAIPEVVSAHHVLAEKVEVWFGPTLWGFKARYVIFFTIWWVLANRLSTWSKKQDETGDIVWRTKMRALAGPALLTYVLTMSFAAFDWAMSLEPLWPSSIYGVMFIVGQGITMWAFSILFSVFLSKYAPLNATLTQDRLHSLGKFLFAFIVLWAYIQLSQLIIIWSADLPEENGWYLNRFHMPYGVVSVLMVVLQFFVPFFILLSRHTKRIKPVVACIAIFLLCMRCVDLWWIISPSIHEPVSQLYGGLTTAAKGPKFHFLDLVAAAGFASLWFGLFVNQFRKLPVLPTRDPVFTEKFQHEAHGS